MKTAEWMKAKSKETVAVRLSFQTEKADWAFVIPATFLWVCSLLVTAWDFVFLQGASYQLSTINLIGIILFLVGVSLRRVGKRTLGRQYSYGLKPPEKLVKHGLYRHVRHPITLAMLLYTAGTPLIFSSLYGFLVALGLIPLVLYRMGIEEKMLTARFGDEYREYVKKTKKLIPFVY